MIRSIRSVRTLTVLLVAAGLGVSAGTASAAVTFSGTGWNPEVNAFASGDAEFSIAGDTLTVILTNTTAPRTTAQGNAMTGVIFDIAGGAPSLALTGTAMTAGSLLWTSKFASTGSASLHGSWTSNLGVSPLGMYGAATTGFGGAFHGGSISIGNGGPNHGIVAAGTFDGTNVSFGGGLYPFIQNSLTLTFSGASGINESQIANVLLLFGTDGTGIVETPAPGAAVLAAMGGLVALRRRR